MLDVNVELAGKTVLVTGSAGFIGSGLVRCLLKSGEALKIVGIDNMNGYYDVSLKEYRLKELSAEPWTFIRGDIADKATIGQ